jgi:hypothetical protein
MKARAPPQNVLSLPQSKCNLGGREERGGVGGGGQCRCLREGARAKSPLLGVSTMTNNRHLHLGNSCLPP